MLIPVSLFSSFLSLPRLCSCLLNIAVGNVRKGQGVDVSMMDDVYGCIEVKGKRKRLCLEHDS